MEQENCIVCLQPITNPVCEECYKKEVNEFLKSQGMDSNAREIITEEIRQKIPPGTLNEDKCILCNKNFLSVCSYCFFDISQRALKELNFHEDFIGYFGMIFIY